MPDDSTGDAHVALVTGSSGGIGRAVVGRFSRAGWRVVGADRRRTSDDEATDRFVELDLTREDKIQQLLDSVRAREGRLDTLINNAAVQVCRPIGEISVEDWDHVMAVNVRAAFLCLRAALPLLRATNGSVVNVSSVHSELTSAQMSVYAASKGGLEAFTRAAAVELAGDRIRVNAVLPGAVDTEMLKRGLQREHLGGEGQEDAVKAFARRQLMGRVARPEEIAEAVHFLADGTRASYITGASLAVDGGALSQLASES